MSKGLISITVHDQVQPAKRPGVATQDVSFAGLTKVSRIAFRNHYTASIAVRATTSKDAVQRGDRESLDGWVTLVKQTRLMDDPHSEDSSQLWHGFGVDDLAGGYGDEEFVALRFYFYQPSPNWTQCGIKKIRVWGKVRDLDKLPESEATSAALAALLPTYKVKSVLAGAEATAVAISEVRRASAAFGIVK
mmetsp:Transcript_7380/g.18428  ORF Transcript_7380/g.18428 Transcript_7380/m.18428 type:complete len:191 (+) Transcript_7380:60-632(+)